jgi:chitinase
MSFITNNVVYTSEPVIAGYFTEWGIYGRNYHVSDIPADKIKHVIYAFAKISNGEIAIYDSYAAIDKFYPGDNWDESLRGNFKQLKLLKAKHPHLKILIAIGGWTLSDPFSDIALTEIGRLKFSVSAANFVENYEFDGIDIDWEYPCGGGLAKGRPEDKKNFTLLMAELRHQLSLITEKTGKQYLLTVASSAGDSMNHYELQEVSKYIDWYNLMAYDFHGSWETSTNHQAALYPSSLDNSEFQSRYNVSYAVNKYLTQGVPPEQIVLGIPFYSRGWSKVHSENTGLFQLGPEASEGTWERGILDYSDVYNKVKNDPKNFLVSWDDEAKASWVFNPYLGGGIFYTFEDEKTLKEKIKFIENMNLRGSMFWEFSGDIRNSNDPASLIHLLNSHKSLKTSKS